MIRLLLIVLVAGSLFGCNSASSTQPDSQWRLVWADEFNYTGLPDPAKWSYDVGGHGWGNKESQYYTDRRKENDSVVLLAFTGIIGVI